jgi:hypothetical protein
VVFPVGSNDLVELRVAGSAITFHDFDNGDTIPRLRNISWVSTGIASLFVEDLGGARSWNGDNLLLLLMNRSGSDAPHYLPVPLAVGF